MYNGTIK